nr:pseudomurein-binding repeat-containing protein [uncultured Methanobacterium sp.]
MDEIKFKFIIILMASFLVTSSLGFAFSINDNQQNSIKVSNQPEFTINEITDAASRVKTYTENNHKLPNYVQISSRQVSMPDFLRLMAVCTKRINSGSASKIVSKHINSPNSPSENLKNGNIYRSEYIDMAQRIESFSDGNNMAPNYVKSSIGNIRFENSVYIYSKVLNYYKEHKTLPNYVSVSKWNTNQDPTLLPYLKPSLNCQSDDNSIISLSRNVASGSDYDKATKVFNWVRDKISYSFYYNTKHGALGTLNQRKGNCCDQTHLLIALCRATGLPAKYVNGECTFKSGNRYGHVWAHVYVSNKWYTADAISSSNSFGVINNWNTATASINGYYRELPF